MKDVFHQQRGKVLIVEPSNPVRLEIQAALRSTGFKHFEFASQVNDAKRYLRTTSFDWIISQTFANENENIYKLLEAAYDSGARSSTYVSLLVNSDEGDFIPKCFELGLLSYHQRHIVKDFLAAQFEQLYATARNCNYDAEAVAAIYLRQYLKDMKMYEVLVRFEQAILKVKPGDSRAFLRIAEAYLQSRRFKEGASYLSQALLIDSNLLSEVQRLKQTYLTPELEYEFKKASAAYDVSKCLIVDPDEAVHIALKPALKNLNISQVHAFTDGESAWKHLLENGEPDLVVCEWKIPKISGPSFIQRMHSKGMYKAPIMVLSSLIKENESVLVSDLGISKVMAKPVDVKQFIVALNQTLQQDFVPSEVQHIERKILKLINRNKLSEARELTESFCSNPQATESRKRYLVAELLYAEGKYDLAKDEIIKVMKHSERDTLATTNLLGKCLMKLGDFQAALQFMQKAHSISPANIDRMCAIAELQMSTEDFEAAESTIQAAKKIDAKNPQIGVTEVNFAILSHRPSAEDEFNKLEFPAQVIAFMNNQAVSCIRSGQIDKGIEIYQKTLGVLQSSTFDEIRARLNYNLGLAFVRKNQYDKAKIQLEMALQNTNESDLLTKSRSLVERLTEAIEKKITLKLRTAESEVGEDENDFEVFDHSKPTIGPYLLRQIEKQSSPAGLCLRGIFKLP